MEKGTKSTKTQSQNLHAGHRQRMFAKLNRGDLCEHELLETLLFFAIPRRNTNEQAHRLLRRFGSLANVLNATADELSQVEGMGENSAAFLQCVGTLLVECGDTLQRAIPKTYNADEFLKFVHEEYRRQEREVADIYLIDDKSNVFMRRRFGGEESNVQFPTKWFQKVLFEHEPTGIVVVHNHPGGDATPSLRDKIAVEKCQAVCLNAGVLLCDFCVAAENGAYSFYLSGELSKIAENCIALNERNTPMTKWEE